MSAISRKSYPSSSEQKLRFPWNYGCEKEAVSAHRQACFHYAALRATCSIRFADRACSPGPFGWRSGAVWSWAGASGGRALSRTARYWGRGVLEL